jgi:hypothetical protein
MSAPSDPVGHVRAFLSRIAPLANQLSDPFSDDSHKSVPCGSVRIFGLLGQLNGTERKITRDYMRLADATTQKYISLGTSNSTAHDSELQELFRREEAERSSAREGWFGELSTDLKVAVNDLCLALSDTVVRPCFPPNLPACLYGPLARLALEYAALVRRYAARRCKLETILINRGWTTPRAKRDRVLRQLQRAKECIGAGSVSHKRWRRVLRRLQRPRHPLRSWRRESFLLQRWSSELRLRCRRPGWNRIESPLLASDEEESIRRLEYRWLRELTPEEEIALDGPTISGRRVKEQAVTSAGSAPSPEVALLTPEDKTILEVLLEAGLALTYSKICRAAADMVLARAREKGRDGAKKSDLVTLSETKVGERVPNLLAWGLIKRPLGPKGKPTSHKGVGITDSGRAKLENKS